MFMSSLKNVGLIVLLAMITVSCKEDLNRRIVGESSIRKISFYDFEKTMLEEKYSGSIEKVFQSSFEQRRDFLREMIYKDIIFDLAEKNQLDTIRMVRDEYSKKLYSIAIMNGLVVDSIRNKIYSEKDILRAYEQRKVKFLPKHILIDTDKHGRDKAKNKIDSIYAIVKSGNKKFEELAKKHSDDIKTGVDGGELGWVFAYDMVKEFEENVLNMKKGDISAPFKSDYGYHIIYLADSKNNEDLKDYQTEKKIIMRDLDKKYSAQFNQIYLNLINSLFVKYDVQLDSANIKTFIRQLKKYSDSSEEGKDALDKFSKDEKEMILSKFGDKMIDVNNVVSALKMFQKQNRPDLKGYDDIRMYTVEKFRNSLLEMYADELGYTKNPEFVSTARSRMYETYRDRLRNIFVRSKIPEPSNEELMDFYEKNKESMFKEQDGTFREFNKVKVSIANSIKGNLFSQSLKEWEENLFKEYKVKMDHALIEKTFLNVKDDKK